MEGVRESVRNGVEDVRKVVESAGNDVEGEEGVVKD